MTTWRAAGMEDPAPGDLEALSRWENLSRTIADEAGNAAQRLGGIRVDDWAGEGAGAYAEQRAQLLPEVRAVHSSHDRAASAMARFIAELHENQHLAAQLLLRYARAEQRAAHAGGEAGRVGRQLAQADSDRLRLRARLAEAKLQAAVPGGDPNVVHAISRNLAAVEADRSRLSRGLGQHRAEESDARAEMERIRSQVASLHRTHSAAAVSAANEIAAAVGASLKSRNPAIRGFQTGQEAVRGAISSDYVKEYLRLLDETIAWISTASLFLSWVPVVGPVLKGVSIVLGVVSFGGHLMRALNGDETWSSALAKGLEIGLMVAVPLALSKATKVSTLNSAMSRTGIRTVSQNPTVNALIGDFYDNPAGYFKQAARWGRAGGRWAGPAGGLIEKSVHAVPVVASREPAAWKIGAYIALGGAQMYTKGMDAIETTFDAVEAFVSPAFAAPEVAR